ncbi:hypothetical protein [Nonomuraea sp. NPDC050691]|uniref:hypothetical protein n=1 Tax=Nonomuraea sp. NPDC050691 TaxID=3155661 RepID=UPI00340E473A
MLLGSYGSTGDRRTPLTKLAAARTTGDGIRLFIEAIDAFAEVLQVRAGRPVVPRAGAPEGRLRRVRDGEVVTTETKAADSEWFTSHWPVETREPGDRPGTPSHLSPGEQWTTKLQNTLGLIKSAKRAVNAVAEHFTAMVPLVGEGREMTAEEREGWQDDLDELQRIVAAASQQLKLLRYRPTDTDATAGGINDFPFRQDVA